MVSRKNGQALSLETFNKFDEGNKGVLNRSELRRAIEAMTGTAFSMEQIEELWEEFDKDDNGTIDYPEFKTMMRYVNGPARASMRTSVLVRDFANMFGEDALENIDEEEFEDMRKSKQIESVVRRSRRDSATLLRSIASEVHHVRNLLCVQESNLFDDHENEGREQSVAVDFSDIMDPEEQVNTSDPDFESAFSPSDMRCLALVSHNGMKKTMREFVVANKNVLKKFRLTGTNSTMTMLKEVFKDEVPGTVVYGPSCSSGPLGGDAELVSHLVGGKIGGIFFFQDPMDSHPHRADIDCLCRQALVHNTMMAETPTSALMLLNTLRAALQGNGKPNLIPSFFFSLQSPTVEAYKKQQKSVVNKHKEMQHRESLPYQVQG